MKKNLVIILLSLALGAILIQWYRAERRLRVVAADTGLALESFAALEDRVIRAFPIYEDYPHRAAIEKRKFGYERHMQAARRFGILVKEEKDVLRLQGAGEYVSIADMQGVYFYGVPRETRFLHTKGAAALAAVRDRFQKKLADREIRGRVLIAVSSAVRWSSYQRELQSRNGNAINESSHSYGVSFDLFFDDFYLFPEFSFAEGYPDAERMRRFLGYLAGDALRRQLKTVLAEALEELEEEGRLYYIYEYNQRVFHVTAAF